MTIPFEFFWWWCIINMPNYPATELAKCIHKSARYKKCWFAAIVMVCTGVIGFIEIRNTNTGLAAMIASMLTAIALIVESVRTCLLDKNQWAIVNKFLLDYHALTRLCGLKLNRLFTFGNVHDGLSEDLQSNNASNPQVVMCAAYGWQAMRKIAEEIAVAELEIDFMKKEGEVVDEARWKKLSDQLSKAIVILQRFGFVDPDEEKVIAACCEPTGPGKIWVPKPPQFVSSSFKRKLCAVIVGILLRRG